MSSRSPLIYSEKVLELFKNPKNLGVIKDGIMAQAGSPACGDVIRIYIKVGKNGVIEDASFESYGCAANIAAASILTEIIKGKTVKDAWKIKWEELTRELGGLPVIKYHCSILAVGALKRVIRKYYENKKLKPKWLPSKLTKEELQALEEEEFIEKMYRRYGGVSHGGEK